jgi:hypothetical protein
MRMSSAERRAMIAGFGAELEGNEHEERKE